MKISLVCFGKVKTPGLAETSAYYRKLIGAWAEISEIELKSLTVPDKSPATRAQIQKKEETILLEKTATKSGASTLILLDERGKSLSTEEWAKLLKAHEADRSLTIAIGSSLGFSDDLRKRATKVLSLGPQTLSHHLARVVLLEQIYRALSVLNNHPYHNQD